MYRIKIILMLSTIIPSLDCCSSRTLFQRKTLNVFDTMEFSSEHSTEDYPNNLEETSSSSTLLHQHAYQIVNNNELATGEGDNSKLNRSQRSDLNKEKTQEDEFVVMHKRNTTENSINQSTEIPMEDAQYKLMSEIVSIECVEWFRLEFCLNGGRCFLYPILNQSLSSCECAEGYVGERCEAKSFEFIPRIRPRFVLARTIGGPFIFGLALVDILFLLFLFCKNCKRD